MRITRWGEYGILCCLHLAKKSALDGEQGVPIGASEIAEQQEIPLQYAQQILHRLRKGGVIKSVRGPHGGFLLSRTPEMTNLRDVLLAAEGHTFELICETDPVHNSACAPENDCGLRLVWQDLQGSINKLLEKHTLASVLAAHPSVLEGRTAQLTSPLVNGPHKRPSPEVPASKPASQLSEKPRTLTLVPPRVTESSTGHD